MENKISKNNLGEINFVDSNNNTKIYEIVLPDLEKFPPDIYANSVVVNNTPVESTFIFSSIQVPIHEYQFPKKNKIEARVVAKIVKPVQVAEGFLLAFQNNWEKFKEQSAVNPSDDKGKK